MTGKNFELKVGIFTFIGLVILFIIVFSIGEFYLFKPGYSIKVMFNFANGITKAAPARVAGVTAGEVEDIKILYDEAERCSKVELSVWIGEGVRIEKDATAYINTLGILGEKYLEIIPGSVEAGFLAEGEALVGKDPIIMDEMTREMKELADATTVVMTRLKDGEGTIGKLLTEEKMYNDLEALVEDIKKHPWKLFHKGREKKPKKERKKK